MTLASLLVIVGRFLLGAYFAQAGVRNFIKLDLHTGILDKKGVPAPRIVLIAGLVVQLLGGLSVALGLYPALGAAGLVVFTLAATWLYHNFLFYSGDERATHRGAAMTNAALIGGLLLVVAPAV